MLLRLEVRGFKNLVDTEIHFGPFVCIAGANGVGKSNLFDVLEFLSGSARQKSLVEAALAVRGDSARGRDYRQIFSHYGERYGGKIELVADLLVPPEATDEFGQTARASSTFLRYSLSIRNRGEHPSGPIEIVHEDLRSLRLGDFAASAPFRFSDAWKGSVFRGKFKSAPLISTEGGRVKLHQDRKKGGKAPPFNAQDLPRTVLSRTIASESPTGLCARKEMASWTFLQLEPNALRKPSSFSAPKRMAANGENLPAAAVADRVAAGSQAHPPQDSQHNKWPVRASAQALQCREGVSPNCGIRRLV
jgi:energy-coupling factor transporter ATP-binding protein EcfA2